MQLNGITTRTPNWGREEWTNDTSAKRIKRVNKSCFK